MAKRQKSLLFFVPYGEWQVHNQLDALISSSANARGYDTHFITCNGTYQPCAITRGQQDCDICQARLRETLDQFAIEGRPLSEIIKSDDVVEADAWVAQLCDADLADAKFNGLSIGEWAISSVMTHFRISRKKDLCNPRVAPTHRRFLRDTLLTFVALSRYIAKHNIDGLFVFNARFYPYRAAFEAAKRKNIRVLVHERGRVADTFSFFNDSYCLDSGPLRDLQNSWKDIPLTEDAVGEISEYLNLKIEGQVLYWPSFYNKTGDFDLHAMLDIASGKKLIGFFTTSFDEIAHLEAYSDPTAQFDLIEKVSSALAGEDAVLVVRHHPAIGGKSIGPAELVSFREAYRRSLARQPHVRVIMPLDPISSHALLPYLDGAIVPFSSFAAETIASGIPTLVANESEMAYSGRFVLEDWSSNSVKKAVSQLVSGSVRLEPNDLRRFYRWCYAGVFRFSVSFRAIGILDFFSSELRAPIALARQPGFDPAVEGIFDYFQGRSSVHPAPSEGVIPSTRAEDTYVAAQVSAIKERFRSQKLIRSRAPSSLDLSLLNVILERASKGSSFDHWRALPFGKQVNIFALGRPFWWLPALSNRFPAAWLGGVAAILSALWIRKLTNFVKSSRQGSYFLISDQFTQFHDVSIAAIVQMIEEATAQNRDLIPLRGWLMQTDSSDPVQVDFSSVANNSHNENITLLHSIGEERPGQFVVFRREWFLRHRPSIRRREDLFQVIWRELSEYKELNKSQHPLFLAMREPMVKRYVSH